MKRTTAPRAKICCIGSRDEAALAVECGASALGLVSAMPSGPGVISDTLIKEIAATIPPSVGSFLLTCKQDAQEIISQHNACRTNCIQLCDRLESGTYDHLRAALPGISLVQVIHVTGPESVDEALEIAASVDAILLDSGNQSLGVKELGGTGRTHDWDLSNQIRQQLEIPMFLAGGLSPSNVMAAIEAVGPFGVDVCSGVRTNGQLDRTKLVRFFSAIRGMQTLSAPGAP